MTSTDLVPRIRILHTHASPRSVSARVYQWRDGAWMSLLTDAKARRAGALEHSNCNRWEPSNPVRIARRRFPWRRFSLMAEVEHGRLAGQNATNDETKQFAQRMVDDHGKVGDELKGLAAG